MVRLSLIREIPPIPHPVAPSSQLFFDFLTQATRFALETTLSGRGLARFLRGARLQGYYVHLIYVWLSGVDLAEKRVGVRVEQGGHDVPSDVIERRYWRGMRNLFNLYLPLADTWTICDNSGVEMALVACGSGGDEPLIHDRHTYDRIRGLVAHDE